MKAVNSILENRPVNTGRQVEVDIARGLAVLFMILVHVTGELSDEATGTSLFGKIIDFFGSIPAAPVFMFVMGIGFVYSRSQEPVKLFKRGIIIFVGAYVLNFFRGFLPFYTGSSLGYYSSDVYGVPWDFFLTQGDILHFAGLSMMFVALLKHLKLKEIYYPIIALAAAVITPFVAGMATGNGIADVFISTVFGKAGYVFHPFFSWIVYPLMGAFFGWLLLRSENKNRFYLKAFCVSMVLIIPGIIYCFLNPEFDLGIVVGDVTNYYQHGIVSNIIFVSFVVIWLSVWHASTSFLPKLVKDRLLFWSKSVTVVYVIHWLIIGWCEFLLLDELNLVNTIIAMVVVVFLTGRFTRTYVNIRSRLKERNDPTLYPHLD